MEENRGQEQGGKDTSPAQPVEQVPDSVSPATPAHEEAEAASGQPDPADDNPATDTDGEADDQAISNTDPEPEPSETPVETEEPSPPSDLPDESLVADENDTHGADDKPEE